AGAHERVWVVPAAGGEPRCLTATLDRSAGGSVMTDMRASQSARLEWSDDGDRLYFQAGGPGIAELHAVDLKGGVAVELACERSSLYDFDVRSGRIAACVTDPTCPGEVIMADGEGQRRLTDANPWLCDRFVAAPERHVFTASDGLQIEGWVLKPPGFDRARKHPLVMQIHGGPHGQYGWAFFHEFQMLAGMGFLVFYTNPRGSDGYGESFKPARVRGWGGSGHGDPMTPLHPFLQRARLPAPPPLSVPRA